MHSQTVTLLRVPRVKYIKNFALVLKFITCNAPAIRSDVQRMQLDEVS